MSILIFFLRETNPNLKKKIIIIIHRSKILKAFENETHTKRPKIISTKSITRIIELLLIRKSILSRCYRRSVTTDSNESDRKKRNNKIRSVVNDVRRSGSETRPDDNAVHVAFADVTPRDESSQACGILYLSVKLFISWRFT